MPNLRGEVTVNSDIDESKEMRKELEHDSKEPIATALTLAGKIERNTERSAVRAWQRVQLLLSSAGTEKMFQFWLMCWR